MIGRRHFSFSTRRIIGDYLQPLAPPEASSSSAAPSSSSAAAAATGVETLRLTEAEVVHLVEQIRLARGWKPRSTSVSG